MKLSELHKLGYLDKDEHGLSSNISMLIYIKINSTIKINAISFIKYTPNGIFLN